MPIGSPSMAAAGLALSILAAEPFSGSDDSRRERARAHELAVVAELRAADASKLSAERLARRESAITALERFARRGDFNAAAGDPASLPIALFDADGRRSALAELLHVSGRDDFANRLRATRNSAWVCELASDAEFLSWLDSSGHSLFDAARIQTPFIGWDAARESSGAPADAGGDSSPRGGESSTPANAAPAGASAPSGPSALHGGIPGQLAPSLSTLSAGANETGWAEWWELNAAPFVRSRRLAMRNASGDDTPPSSALHLATQRAALADLLRVALADADPDVRGAAVLTLGRFGGADAVERIVPLLADPSDAVRRKALLAVGATGTSQALRSLMYLIRSGAVDGRTRVSAEAEVLAMVGAALGRTRANGLPSEMDAIVTVRLRERTTADREAVGCAAFVYQVLAPCASLETLALELACDERESVSVRCRALEALRSSRHERALPVLQDQLASARVDLRRSAALALGELRHPLALAALLTATELESDALARGFALVSIGRQGGERAFNRLRDELASGPSTQRAWCALALGLLGNAGAGERASRELRDALARENNRDAEGAYCIALGLTRDPAAVPVLSSLARESAHARTRAYASSALGLIGDASAHEALVACLERERDPHARATAAFALGAFGVVSDLDALRPVLAESREPRDRGLAAHALAFHGSREAWELLLRAARERETARAAAIDALGVMLDAEPPFRLGEAGRQSNPARMPDWLRGALATSY